MRELGRGGMGVVFLAMRDDGAFRKNVALKVLLKERVTDEFVQRFRQERQVLAALDHPNIARILDGGDAPNGLPYYVMEYVEGVAIEQYCDEQRLSLADRIRLFQQVCHAVHYLHEHMIVHRDLKPSNILVSNEGLVKLLDFGIAKMMLPVAMAGPDLTGVTGQPLTPNYASPEQLAGGAAQKTSDIYALGVILYRLLTGRLPYQGLEDKLAKVQSREEPPLPSQNIRADLQTTPETTAQLKRRMMGDLDHIVLMTMRFNPKERYQTAAELSDDLQKFLDGLPVRAHKQGLFGRSGRLLKRKWVVVAAVAAFLLLGGVSVWQWVRMHNEEAQAAGREAELRKLLDSLEARAKQDNGAPQDMTQRIADLRRLRDAFDKELAPLLAMNDAAPAGTKAILAQAARYLDRLAPQAQAAPELGLELATTYQQAGILQEKSVKSNPAGSGALQSYTKSATLLNQVAAVNPSDPRIGARLAVVNQRIKGLGGTAVTMVPVQAPVETPAVPAVESAPAAQVRPPGGPPPTQTPSVAPPAAQNADPAPAVSSAEMEAAQEQMVSVAAKVATAEQTLEPYKRDLAQSGQTLNPDLLSAASRMKTQLELGRRYIASGNPAAAKEALSAADGLASKVLRAVGR